MKTLLKGITFAALSAFALASCTSDKDYYDPEEAQKIAQAEAEAKFQAMKLPCVNAELAKSTNWYGMKGKPSTRTTDGGNVSAEIVRTLTEAYKNATTETEPVTDAWYVLLESGSVWCDKNGGGNSGIDMPGFNAGDQPGKTVYINSNEQTPNVSWCPDGANHHQAKKVYKTDGTYTFVEIWALDYSNGPEGEYKICKVYATLGYHPTQAYFLCIEDLGGSALDYNDIIIACDPQKNATVIWRGGNYAITITDGNQWWQGNFRITLPANQYGAQNIDLGYKPNSVSDWGNISISYTNEKGVEIKIPVTLKSASDQPAVIATSTMYKFHKDENSMSSAEFASIPYYGM